MVENFATLSHHASFRMLERFGFECVDVKQNIANRAWKNGKTYLDYSGKASRFLFDVQNRHGDGNHVAKTFGDSLFIFSLDGVLCTVFAQSPAFKKLKTKTPIYHEAAFADDEDYCYYNFAA